MNVAHKVEPITPEEFEMMEKDERFSYELIDGVVMMSPSPSREHQFIGSNIIGTLSQLLKGLRCRAAYELDIHFNDNVFRPDVLIFCDKDAKLPEIVFEILSPSNRYLDLNLKCIKYEEAGIKEYWIVDPKFKNITIHDFVNQTAETYGVGETIRSKAIPEVIITVADIFA